MRSFSSVRFALMCLASCSIVFGQNPPIQEKSDTPSEKKQDAPGDKPMSKQENPPATKPTLEDNPQHRFSKPGYGRDAMVDRRLSAFVRLRELMFESVKLDTDKRKKIDRMFDDYMAGLLNRTQMPHGQPQPQDMATPQELPELRKQLEAAEKSHDEEKITSIKAKIACAMIVLEPCVIDEPSFFFDYVSKELNEAQFKEFEPVLNRLRMIRLAEIAPDNDFKQLRRATRDPALPVSEEVKKQLDTVVIESLRTVPLGPQRNDPTIMKELAAKTKPKILEKLDPKAREHFEKTVEMLKRWTDEDPQVAKKTREYLKDHKPAPVEGMTAAPATTGSSPQP